MKKFGKMSVIAAFTLAMTLLASIVAPSFADAADEKTTSGGFVSNAVEITGENEALSGWQYYFYNNTLQWYYQSNELFVRATKNGRTGNAMEIERKKSSDELWVYSYSFDVEPSTNYNISAYVKISDATGKLVWCVKELDESGADVLDSTTGGATQYVDRHSVSGVLNEWTETSFSRKTEATTKKIILRIRAEGTGIIDIDDLTVAKTVAPNTISYRMMGIGNDGTSETPASYNEITADDIVNDSSDGDGKALRLDDHDVFNATFGMLPHGYNYEISFKYKSVNGERMSFYLDNVSPSGERAWYADGVSGGSTTEWTSYSYKFSAVTGQTDIVYFRLASYGTYYIDEFEVKSINEYVLNGTFENSKYYHTVSGENHYSYFRIVNSSTDISGSSALFNDTSSILSASNISTDSADGDGKSVKLSANDYLKVTYAPKKLDDDKTYTLSFKYKKLDSVSGSYIRTRLDHVTVSGPQGWNGPNGEQGVEGEWVTYSFDFTTNANPDGQHVTADWVTISAQGGDFLIDDISVTCKTFDDMQYMPNGNFSGAYTEGYQLNQNFNVAKQSDGTYVFTAASNTSAFGMANCYMRLNVMSSLPTGKEYTLSFDYRSGGAQAVRVFYGLSWTDATLPLKNILTCGQATSPAWVHKEVTFTHTNPDAYLEIYGNENYSGTYPSYIKNIQITDKSTGETFITNQSLIAPDKGSTTAYSSDFGTGNAEYTWKDWTIENGGIYGFVHEDGKNENKICLDASADKTATAISKDIDVTGVNVLKIEQKIYYAADPAFGSNLTVTVLAGDKEITADSNGYFILPEGTTSIRVKYAANEYVTFKKVFVNTHAHGEECKNVAGEQTNVYEFSADNTTCTATRYYACGAVVKTETVNTVLSGDTATFTETGTATCTATFEDSGFETQTKTVETPMKETPEVGMKVGASMRTNEPYGIRWTSKIRTADWEKLVTLYGEENVKAGVLVAPFDYVKNGDTVTELTVEAFKAAGLNYVDIVTDTFNADAGKGMEGYSAFYASLVNIQTANLNRKFIARAYIAVENDGVTTYYYGEYSEENQARSIYEISKKVIVSDTESTATKQFAETGVLDKVVEVTVENGEATLATIDRYDSPYTVTLDNGVLTISVANAESGANISNIGIVCVNGKNYKPTVSGDVVTVSIN